MHDVDPDAESLSGRGGMCRDQCCLHHVATAENPQHKPAPGTICAVLGGQHPSGHSDE